MEGHVSIFVVDPATTALDARQGTIRLEELAPAQPHATASFGMKYRHNLELADPRLRYEALEISVHVSLPCHPEKLPATMRLASEYAFAFAEEVWQERRPR